MIRRAPLAAALVVLPACGAFDACVAQTKDPIVYVDIVDRASAAEGIALPREHLERGARRAMKHLDGFAFREASAAEVGWQLDLEVQLVAERTADAAAGQAPDPNLVHRACGVQLRLHALGVTERAPSRVAIDVMLTRDEPWSVPFGALAEAAVGEGGRRLQRALDLYWGPASAVMEALEAEDDWIRIIAADAAGVRHLRGAVDPLMERVRDDEESPEVRIRAVGALVELRAPRAAGAIIDACRRQDAPYLVQMVFALGQLGGREAQGYLFTVQSGHPDPSVRDAASQALEELERGARERGGAVRAPTAEDSLGPPR